MMRFAMVRLLFVVVAGLLGGGCGNDAAENPAEARQTYGASVDPTDAIPVPAIAAEASRYGGQSVTVDGRIAGVARDGCTLHLDAGNGPSLRVNATRSGEGTCAWRVPAATDGFAVATGTLRADADTLRLTANGVQVTPVQISTSDS